MSCERQPSSDERKDTTHYLTFDWRRISTLQIYNTFSSSLLIQFAVRRWGCSQNVHVYFCTWDDECAGAFVCIDVWTWFTVVFFFFVFFVYERFCHLHLNKVTINLISQWSFVCHWAQNLPGKWRTERRCGQAGSLEAKWKNKPTFCPVLLLVVLWGERKVTQLSLRQRLQWCNWFEKLTCFFFFLFLLLIIAFFYSFHFKDALCKNWPPVEFIL